MLLNVNGQTPQQDYTLAAISAYRDILTGGPLVYGSPLSALWDVTGPDLLHITAFLESEKGFAFLPTRIAQYTQHERSPLPIGVLPLGRANMVDLRPQGLWLLPAGL